ncbi:MAG TPA: sugar phosphate nucleotidyltransferase [Thermoanaerobaculia bacterium]|jgi:NDP-sugar pyrophosphorylase family protein|nr:sugar phosphate nucleotidyltransferase [Thermoanaerobaculia bacterium]
MKVVVLAGGLGTRLGALARGLPKSMIRVAGRPFLEHIIDSFASRGLREFVLLVGHHADVIEAHFHRGDGFGVQIEYSREKELLGTGGAVREAGHLITDRFILTYGDVLRRFDYDRFVEEHPHNCLAAYPKITEGNTDAANGVVTRFDKNAKDLPYVDAGFSVLQRETIDLLPPAGACSFEQEVYTKLAARRELECEIVDHDFYDIGTPEELAKTRADLEAR